MYISSNDNFRNFRPRPAAFWFRSDRGNRVEFDGPEGVIVYQRRRTGDYRSCLRTKGLKKIWRKVDFRRWRYSSETYGDEDAGCRRGWPDVRGRILDAAESVA